MHWAWPFPIDEHITIPVARIHTMEISFMPGGLEKTREGGRRAGNTLLPGVDKYCLTGDANIVHSKWAVRYTIAEPLAYITAAEEPEKALFLLRIQYSLHIKDMGDDLPLNPVLDAGHIFPQSLYRSSVHLFPAQ